MKKIPKSLPFAEAQERLDKILAAFESGGVSLEQSMELYEEGVALADFCEKKLGEAEQKLTRLAEPAEE